MTIRKSLPPKIVHSEPKIVELDAIDRRILGRLAVDGRLANNALADDVGIAPSTCLLRVRRLQETGVITGFRADVAPAALGRPLQALISVRLQAEARKHIGRFAAQYGRLPGVLNVFFLGGPTDFLIHVAVPSPDELRQFVVQHLSATDEVATTETSLIFEHVAVATSGIAGPLAT